MSKNENDKGNLLIAKFMDAHVMIESDGIVICLPNVGMWFSGKKRLKQHQEKCFHSDWNWLIPAVNKAIGTIGIRTIDECTDYEWRLFTAICEMKLSTPINIVYKNLVQYIEWYNTF